MTARTNQTWAVGSQTTLLMSSNVNFTNVTLTVAVDSLLEWSGPVAATVGGVFLEPLDWALTAREIWNDPTSGWSYAGLIPFVPAGAGG